MEFYVFISALFTINAVEALIEHVNSVVLPAVLKDGKFTPLTEKDVSFFYYSRKDRENFKQLSDINLSLIDPEKPLKYIIHGWTESRVKEWYFDMTQEYLKRYDCQVIQVDWSGPAATVYQDAALNVREVGRVIAEHIMDTKIPVENIHIIGHSLGGHAAGFVGKYIQKLTGGKQISRITGLDAAGPLFENKEPTDRLDKSDGKFVDVIHTDIGVFGYYNSIGTVDFYPNGGRGPQPGCVGLISDNSETTEANKVFCSHHRSFVYFIQSINLPIYLATKCSNYIYYKSGLCNMNTQIIFGENVSPIAPPGVYYLEIL